MRGAGVDVTAGILEQEEAEFTRALAWIGRRLTCPEAAVSADNAIGRPARPGSRDGRDCPPACPSSAHPFRRDPGRTRTVEADDPQLACGYRGLKVGRRAVAPTRKDACRPTAAFSTGETPTWT
jgi:hypothetical protein